MAESFIFLFFWRSRLTLPEYIIVSSNLSCRTRAWFACSRRRHAMERRSELAWVSVYGDDLHKAASACADSTCVLQHIFTLGFDNFNSLLWRRPRQQTRLHILAAWIYFVLPNLRCFGISVRGFGVSASKHRGFPINTPEYLKLQSPIACWGFGEVQVALSLDMIRRD